MSGKELTAASKFSKSNFQLNKGVFLPLSLMAILWAGAVLLVNPLGDFPLNDDFSYGRSVLNLLEQGRLIFDEWLAMTLLVQVLWGAGFCKIFGFSFTVLRFSTLVLGYAGIVTCYFLGRELGMDKRVSLLTALVVAFNPFFFSLSCTFMTDVPFFTFSILATLFYCKAFRTGSWSWILTGTLFALAATFVRQLGLMLPLAFGLAWLFRRSGRRAEWIVAALPALLATGLFFWYSHWLSASQGLPDGYGNFQKLFQRLGEAGFLEVAFYRLGILSAYLGVFLLPVSLLLFPALRRENSGKNSWPVYGMLILATGAFIAAWDKLPWGNLLYNLGLGPKLLKDGFIQLNIRPVLPAPAVSLLKLASLPAMWMLVFLLLKRISFREIFKLQMRPAKVFALANLGIYGVFLALDKHFFDRYFFQLLPFLLILMMPQKGFSYRKPLYRIAFSLVFLQAAFSIAATRDYLSWNRARWQALNYLTTVKNVHPGRIDGGFEFNGWHKPGPRDNGPWKSWWWVDRDDYVIAFGDLPNFTKEKGFAYIRWLPPGVDSVYILKHN